VYREISVCRTIFVKLIVKSHSENVLGYPINVAIFVFILNSFVFPGFNIMNISILIMMVIGIRVSHSTIFPHLNAK